MGGMALGAPDDYSQVQQGQSGQSLGGSPMQNQPQPPSPTQRISPQIDPAERAALDRARGNSQSPIARILGGALGRNTDAEYLNMLEKNRQQEANINYMNQHADYLKTQSTIHGISLLGQFSNMSPEVQAVALPAISALLGHGTEGHTLMDPRMLAIIGSGGQQYVNQMVSRFPILSQHPEVAPELAAAVRANKGNPEAINKSLSDISDRIVINHVDAAAAKIRASQQPYLQGQPLQDFQSTAKNVGLTPLEVESVGILEREKKLPDSWYTSLGVKAPGVIEAEQKAAIDPKMTEASRRAKAQAELEHTTPGNPMFGKMPPYSLARMQRENDLFKQISVPPGGASFGMGTGLAPQGVPSQVPQQTSQVSLPTGQPLATRPQILSQPEVEKYGKQIAAVENLEKLADDLAKWQKGKKPEELDAVQAKIFAQKVDPSGFAMRKFPLDPEAAALNSDFQNLITEYENAMGGARAVSQVVGQQRFSALHGGSITNPNVSIMLKEVAKMSRSELEAKQRAAGTSPGAAPVPQAKPREGNQPIDSWEGTLSKSGKYIWKGGQWQPR